MLRIGWLTGVRFQFSAKRYRGTRKGANHFSELRRSQRETDERELDARPYRNENFIRSLRRCANIVDERNSTDGRIARGKRPFRTALSL